MDEDVLNYKQNSLDAVQEMSSKLAELDKKNHEVTKERDELRNETDLLQKVKDEYRKTLALKNAEIQKLKLESDNYKKTST